MFFLNFQVEEFLCSIHTSSALSFKARSFPTTQCLPQNHHRCDSSCGRRAPVRSGRVAFWPVRSRNDAWRCWPARPWRTWCATATWRQWRRRALRRPRGCPRWKWLGPLGFFKGRWWLDGQFWVVSFVEWFNYPVGMTKGRISSYYNNPKGNLE